MLEHLFGSKTRLRLLRVFFRNPEKVFFVRELARLVEGQVNAIRRELALLIEATLVKEIDSPTTNSGAPGEGLRKYYALNSDSVIYPELYALLLKGQLFGEQQLTHDIQAKFPEIKFLLVTGQFTGDARAQSDLLVVGKVKEQSLAKLIESSEHSFGFPIRYTVLTEREFADRREIMDKFLYSLFEATHVVVVDNLAQK